MSSPYRDAEVPVDEIETPDAVAPLATFDVSGQKGADGDDGRHGTGGSASGRLSGESSPGPCRGQTPS